MIVPTPLDLSSSDLARGALPANPRHCPVHMLATVGPDTGNVGDDFSFTVVTLSALAESERIGWGSGTPVVNSFSQLLVEHSVNRPLAQACRPSWQGLPKHSVTTCSGSSMDTVHMTADNSFKTKSLRGSA